MKIRIENNFSVNQKDAYIFFYFIVYIFHFFSSFNPVYSFIIWGIVGLFGYYVFWQEIKENSYEIFTLFFVDILGGLSLMINHNHSVGNIIILISSHILGLYLYSRRKDLKIIIIPILVFVLYITVYVVITPKTVLNDYTGESTVIFSGLVGGNSISIFNILFLSVYAISRYYLGLKVNYIPFILALISAYIGGGTGGVVTILLLIVGIFFLDWYKDKFSIKKITYLLIIGILVITILNIQRKLLDILTDDNARLFIWTNYIQSALSSFKSFLFGGSVKDIPLASKLKNIHNSYLNFHYYYGIIPFVFYISIIITTILHNIKMKNALMVVILITIFLRGMTDEASFGFMPIWTFAYLEMINSKKNNNDSLFRLRRKLLFSVKKRKSCKKIVL